MMATAMMSIVRIVIADRRYQPLLCREKVASFACEHPVNKRVRMAHRQHIGAENALCRSRRIAANVAKLPELLRNDD